MERNDSLSMGLVEALQALEPSEDFPNSAMLGLVEALQALAPAEEPPTVEGNPPVDEQVAIEPTEPSHASPTELEFDSRSKQSCSTPAIHHVRPVYLLTPTGDLWSASATVTRILNQRHLSKFSALRRQQSASSTSTATMADKKHGGKSLSSMYLARHASSISVTSTRSDQSAMDRVIQWARTLPTCLWPDVFGASAFAQGATASIFPPASFSWIIRSGMFARYWHRVLAQPRGVECALVVWLTCLLADRSVSLSDTTTDLTIESRRLSFLVSLVSNSNSSSNTSLPLSNPVLEPWRITLLHTLFYFALFVPYDPATFEALPLLLDEIRRHFSHWQSQGKIDALSAIQNDEMHAWLSAPDHLHDCIMDLLPQSIRSRYTRFPLLKRDGVHVLSLAEPWSLSTLNAALVPAFLLRRMRYPSMTNHFVRFLIVALQPSHDRDEQSILLALHYVQDLVRETVWLSEEDIKAFMVACRPHYVAPKPISEVARDTLILLSKISSRSIIKALRLWLLQNQISVHLLVQPGAQYSDALTSMLVMQEEKDGVLSAGTLPYRQIVEAAARLCAVDVDIVNKTETECNYLAAKIQKCLLEEDSDEEKLKSNLISLLHHSTLEGVSTVAPLHCRKVHFEKLFLDGVISSPSDSGPTSLTHQINSIVNHSKSHHLPMRLLVLGGDGSVQQTLTALAQSWLMNANLFNDMNWGLYVLPAGNVNRFACAVAAMDHVYAQRVLLPMRSLCQLWPIVGDVRLNVCDTSGLFSAQPPPMDATSNIRLDTLGNAVEEVSIVSPFAPGSVLVELLHHYLSFASKKLEMPLWSVELDVVNPVTGVIGPVQRILCFQLDVIGKKVAELRSSMSLDVSFMEVTGHCTVQPERVVLPRLECRRLSLVHVPRIADRLNQIGPWSEVLELWYNENTTTIKRKNTISSPTSSLQSPISVTGSNVGSSLVSSPRDMHSHLELSSDHFSTHHSVVHRVMQVDVTSALRTGFDVIIDGELFSSVACIRTRPVQSASGEWFKVPIMCYPGVRSIS